MSGIVQRSLARVSRQFLLRQQRPLLAHNYPQLLTRSPVRHLTTASNDDRNDDDDNDDTKNSDDSRIVELVSSRQPFEAESLLKTFAAKSDETDDTWPSLGSYNAVLDLLIEETKRQPAKKPRELSLLAEKTHRVLRLIQNHENFSPALENYHKVLEAWKQIAYVRGVPQRSSLLLKEMEESAAASEQEETIAIGPTIETYNLVLSIWGESQEHMRGSRAQAVFEEIPVNPTPQTHRIMLHAWLMSEQYQSVMQANSHLVTMSKKSDDDPEMEPTLHDYQCLFEAWTREQRYAAEQALNLMHFMEKNYRESRSTVRPDLLCYRSLLRCLARSEDQHDLGYDVDSILRKMKSGMILPDTDCYGYAIRTWVQGAHHEGCENPLAYAERAYTLLEEMEVAYHRSREILVELTTENFNDVLRALNLVGDTPGAIRKSKALLRRMEVSAEDSLIRPNSESYTLVFAALEKQRSDGKVEEGSTILDGMVKWILRSQETESCNPPDVTKAFNAFVRLCTSVKRRKEAAFQQAVRTQQRMFEVRVRPDEETFLVLLQACAKLLLPGKERTTAMQMVFQNCCKMGLLNDAVFEIFRDKAPDQLYSDLVLTYVRKRSDRLVPESWTRNMPKRVSIDTRSSETDDSQHEHTPLEETEARMERRRAKQALNLLKGGRS